MPQLTNLELLIKLREATFTDEDGEAYRLAFQPSLSEAEITQVAQRFPAGQLAPELRQLLALTKGWDGYGLDSVYFDSIGEFGFTELLPHSVTLGHDGFGNFWVLDIDSQGNLGRVFFACHDPAVLVIQAQCLNDYLHQLLAFYQHPAANCLNKVHEEVVAAYWQQDRFISGKDNFLAANPAYREFLASCEGPDWVVADLRTGETGAGFAWGRHGSNTLTRRHPTELLWVLKKRRPSFWQRLWRR